MRISFMAIGLCLLQALTGRAPAAEVYGAPARLHVTREQEPVNYAEPTYRAWVTAGSNQFSFIMPRGFSFQGDPATGTLKLGNREGNSLITLSIFDSVPANAPVVNIDVCRELVLRQHPTAKIVQELYRGAAGGNGPAFDLQWKEAGEIVECKRVVYIPSGAGVLEFTATTGRANFPALQSGLDTLLMTFCYGTNGTLKVSRLSDRS